MDDFSYDSLAQRIVFGVGAVDRLPAEIASLGVRRLLLIAGGSAKPVADELAESLAAVVARFGDVRQHVPERLVAAATTMAREHDADAILTIGGGSATGLGKAVGIAIRLPLVAVPTTYAGSEATPVFGITGQHKQTGRDPLALPRLVIYDPALTYGLPPTGTATTGCNALAHCIEAMYAPATNPVAQLLAEEGLRILGRALPAAVRRPDDTAARSDALYGAYLAGSALASAGTALHHKLCHVLGGSYGLVHGEVNAVLLPYVVAYNTRAVPAEMSRVARALGGTDATKALSELVRTLPVPSSLAEIGMPADGLADAAERAVAAVGTANPRPVDARSLRRLLEDAYWGRPPAPQEGGLS